MVIVCRCMWCLCIIFPVFVAPMTGMRDLVYVRRSLRTLLEWKALSLSLGLARTEVMRIEKEQRGDIDYCIMEMLAFWMRNQPDASRWSTLKTALKNIGENELADTIPTDGELEWLSGWLTHCRSIACMVQSVGMCMHLNRQRLKT